MTREEKCKSAIDKGYLYNPETGIVIGPRGNIISKKQNSGYIIIRMRIGHKRYDLLVHQFAWYVIFKEIVDCLDHINNIKHDNRICNIRSVTPQQNAFNRLIKGYSFCNREKKFIAKIKVNGIQKSLGYYDSEEQAKEAYLKAKEDLHIIKEESEETIQKNLLKYNKPESKGYCFDKTRNKYKSSLSFNGKNIHLGRFDTEEEAREAYLKAKMLYGIK